MRYIIGRIVSTTIHPLRTRWWNRFSAEAAGCPTDGHPHLEGRNGEEDRECHPKDAAGEEVMVSYTRADVSYICWGKIWRFKRKRLPLQRQLR